MYRILIVSDIVTDEQVFEYEKRFISYLELKKSLPEPVEFSFAKNYKQALQAFSHFHPHILVTRIGFILDCGIEALLKMIPQIKIIVSSENCTLEHIVSLFNQGIFYFIQEPALAFDYVSAMQKAIRQIQKEETAFELEQKKSQLYEECLLEKMLNQLMKGAVSFQECLELFPSRFSIFLPCKFFETMIFDLSRSAHLSDDEFEAACQAVKFILNEYVQNHGFLFLNEKQQFVIIAGKPSIATPPPRKNVLDVTNHRIQELSEIYHCHIVVGFGKPVMEVDQISNSYRQSSEAVDWASGLNRTALIDFTLHDGAEDIVLPRHLMEALKNSSNKPAAFHNSLDQLVAHLNALPILSSHQVRLVALKLLNCLGCQEDVSLLNKALRLRWADDFFDLFKAFTRSEQERTEPKELIVRVKEYISEHYSESSLSLNSVAQKFYLSPPYLSRIFKQKMHVSFTEYLFKVRIEQAKKLFKQKDLKTSEIATMVGYQDPSYFSACFKKYIGMTPGSFRKTL